MHLHLKAEEGEVEGEAEGETEINLRHAISFLYFYTFQSRVSYAFCELKREVRELCVQLNRET